jgi:hypothetical protein
MENVVETIAVSKSMDGKYCGCIKLFVSALYISHCNVSIHALGVRSSSLALKDKYSFLNVGVA